VQQSADKGEYLKKQLEELKSHPTIGDVRGLGLMCGIEIVKNKSTKEKFGRDHEFTKRLSKVFDDKGLLTRAWDVVHFAPPFVITTDEIDRMVAIVDEALSAAEAEFASDIA
jgi:adenosylmethionine-8-amino-7-oxononanoate aminotransferase